ncbi:RNAse G [Mariprofundus ferrinatatus]|uniref:Ribonuclease G n=1 Tax=Mariprofundus ferrinatatus TaxID=1921087 RepID=A0A2K8L5S2_9PROT|nr:ribonuclease G [Mariprofundus ferrinatatus]ATX82583.1 RNAse G [Mariprofundus ferrinatatus]
MSIELLVNVAPFETRIARIENNLAEEIYIERESERGLKGNIYKGRVQRVLPGIQAAFVDIGMEKAGFLYAGDIATAKQDDDVISDEMESGDETGNDNESPESHYSRRNAPAIDSLIKDGQELMVQVSREPIASKGPRLTTQIGLAGRYLVYLPHLDHIGIARRLEEPKERERLLEIGEKLSPKHGGLIIRTVAEGRNEEDMREDLDFLLRLWGDIEKRSKGSSLGTMIHKELNLYLRVMRDYVDSEVEKIHIDSKEAYESMKKFARRFMPEVAKKLYYYPGQRPIFDVYGVEDAIDRALQRRVPLKSGGYIVIDQTEALIAIDVNSGSFVGSRNMEETGFKTNLEAVHEIVHQLRLRNLGGIIVVDFIDMEEQENRQRLMEVLKEALKRDKAKTHIVQLSELGLVEMTRKRTRESLGRILLKECHRCHGVGSAKSSTTICYQLFREVVAEARAYPCEKLMVIAHPEIIDLMLGEENKGVEQLEQFLGKEITLESNEQFAPDHYEIVLQ